MQAKIAKERINIKTHEISNTILALDHQSLRYLSLLVPHGLIAWFSCLGINSLVLKASKRLEVKVKMKYNKAKARDPKGKNSDLGCKLEEI